MARFQLIIMSSYAKNKIQMCSVTQRQSRHRHICRKLLQIHPVHLLFVCNKKCLVFTEQCIHARFQLVAMSSYAKNYRCVQALNISVDVAKCVEIFHKFTQYTHLLSLTKNDLSSQNNLFLARFQFIRKCYYAKNKLQLCSVTQHQCRCRQMCEQFHKFTQYTHFCLLLKMTFLEWTINSWQGFNSLGCPLMLRTNYRCAQLLNIIVDVAKCVENFDKFTQYTHFLSVTKNDLSSPNNLFMASFQLISMSFYAKNKLNMCSVTQHQCRLRQMGGKFSQIHKVNSLFVCYKKSLLFTEQSIHG